MKYSQLPPRTEALVSVLARIRNSAVRERNVLIYIIGITNIYIVYCLRNQLQCRFRMQRASELYLQTIKANRKSTDCISRSFIRIVQTTKATLESPFLNQERRNALKFVKKSI